MENPRSGYHNIFPSRQERVVYYILLGGDSIGGVGRIIFFYLVGVKHSNGIADPIWKVQHTNSDGNNQIGK